MRMPGTEARRVIDLYSGLRERAHLTIRWAGCPFEEVEALVPRRGRVLDFGCGHGHFSAFLAQQSSERVILGVDTDAAKLAIGRAAIARSAVADAVTLEQVEHDWTPAAGSFDAVVVADVVYLLGPLQAARVLGELAAALRPGGVLVVKEMGDEPVWRRRLSTLQEQLAVRVFRWTKGDTVAWLTQAQMIAPLAAAGLAVERHPLHQGYPVAHLAVRGVRPGSPGSG